jgi:hypothetical protein
MQTKSEISRVFVVLYFVGIALLLVGFFLLVPPEWRTDAARLDLAIAFIVYSVNFPLVSIWWSKPASFNSRIPALGLLGLCDLFYSICAIGLGWYGIVYLLSFRLQLIGQLCLLFLALVVAAIAWMASAHAVEMTEEEKDLHRGLDRLRASIGQCESEIFTRTPIQEQLRQRILKLKEDARYLSPSSDISALSYEEQIATLVDNIRLKLSDRSTPSTSSSVDGQFEQCAALMALRNQVR